MQPLQNINVLRQIKGVEIESGTNFAVRKVEAGLLAVEALVAEMQHIHKSQSNAKFAVGTAYPTLADICIVPQVYSARRLGIIVDCTTYPSLEGVLQACDGLAAFHAAAPDCQPDAV